MRILVIGGTRFIGLAAVGELARRGHELSLFHRGVTQAVLPPGVQEISGDRRRLHASADALLATRPDAVLDMMAVVEADADDAISCFAGKLDRYIVASSIDVYLNYGRAICAEPGDPPDSPINETSPLRTRLYPYRGADPRADDDPKKLLDDYDKIPIERKLMDEKSFATTVLRLPMVYGPGDYQHRMFPYLKRISDGRPHVVVGESHAAWKAARGYVDDVALAIALALEDDSARGEIFNVCEERALTEVEWARSICASAGYTGDVIVVPDSLLPTDDHFDPRSHLSADSSKIRSMLGYQERSTVQERFDKTVEWERDNPPAEFDASQFDYAAEDAALAAHAARGGAQ
jgi:nucleoside-diphosphate-sugar epimerase